MVSARKKWNKVGRGSQSTAFPHRRRLQLLKLDKWLALGKDVWRIIFTTLVTRVYYQSRDHDHHRYAESIGDYDYPEAQLLRSVCRTFSVWISPNFCLGVIYLNPVADTSRVIVRWKGYFAQLNPHGGGPTYDEPNPFFGRKHIYLSTRWKWNFNPENREPQIATDDVRLFSAPLPILRHPILSFPPPSRGP